MSKQRKVAAVFAAVLIGAWALTGAAGALAAQDRPEEAPPASYDEQIDAFFLKLAAGEHAEAVDGLYGGSPIAAELGDQLGDLKNQLGEIASVVGEYVGRERIAVQPLGERFVYAWYVAYFDKRPLQVHFSFYKPRDRWLVFQLSYDQALASTARELAVRRLAESPPE
ncbi:MAG TPA: hypothetical protein VLF66_15745 [Thermoanaerobaculia bacterium]|nr:hypothetical protein [Thermoanaerobaculia bacterium]